MESRFFVSFLIILLSLVQTAFSGCSYVTYNTYGYSCDFTIQNPNGQNNFTDISGGHAWFRGDGNVQAVFAESGSYSIIVPDVICNKFYNSVWLILGSIGIKVVDNFAFRNCKNLEYVNLSYNKITDISGMSFTNNLQLTTLLLYNNQLSSLPESVFGKLQKLTTLKLNNNKLTALPQNIFSATKALKQLNLEQNQIEKLPSNIFASLTNLQTLDMSYNNISNISTDWFKSLGNLLTLYLDGNLIEELPKNAFSSLKKVTKIYLNYNKLKIIHSDAFGVLPSLTYIYLQNNEIDGFYEKIIDNTKVYSLNLSGNLCASVNIFDNSTTRETMRAAMEKCFDNYEMTVFGCISGNSDARICKLEGENEKNLITFQEFNNKTQTIASQTIQLSEKIETLKKEKQELRSDVGKITAKQEGLLTNFTNLSVESQELRDSFNAQMEIFTKDTKEKGVLIAENRSDIEKLHALFEEMQLFLKTQLYGYEELHNQVNELTARPCECR